MYPLDVIKSTKLAKKLGGPPIFNDGYLQHVLINADTVILDIKILAQNNPLLNNDTQVKLHLKKIHSIRFNTDSSDAYIMIIHDIDVRKEGNLLHLILESSLGEISEFIFESIELND
ncbi:hypothetical protein [Liberiplasma polymorphum]|uniref:hypothetical protein n=1 Tax=Liberiplasma polymorphum TaxID=3374570 RepID=UPI0037710FE3